MPRIFNKTIPDKHLTKQSTINNRKSARFIVYRLKAYYVCFLDAAEKNGSSARVCGKRNDYISETFKFSGLRTLSDVYISRVGKVTS